MDKKELSELVNQMVDKFALTSNYSNLNEELVDFLYNSTRSSIEIRKENFVKELSQYKDEYGSDILNRFYAHWTGTQNNGWKMAFEKEKTFNMKLRLDTWRRNGIKFNAINIANKQIK